MIYIDTERRVIKSWCNNPEEGALKQAKNLANLPFLFKHVALMPDTQQGYGMPIGGVIATERVVIPNAVGMDIGCGMLAIKTSLKEIDKASLKNILSDIRATVPVGLGKQHSKPQIGALPNYDAAINKYSIIRSHYTKGMHQIGTMGAGNHFIEIQKGSDDHIWFMVHSGSRNIGYQVAKHYNKIAIELNQKWYSAVDKKTELAFLPIDTKQAKDYLAEMNWCLAFSYYNRQLMALRIKEAFSNHTTATFEQEVNIHHNYAKMENHFGKNVMIHRKGATSARKGEMGIIPGSQGSPSYIVSGKGNPDSFMSCSHGAGRKMGRGQAIRTLSYEDEVNKLEKMGVIHSIRNINDLDEADGAYKDIDIVMSEQEDLVNIEVKLMPLAVIKGQSDRRKR